jgi:2-methylcitrate dehydratase
MKHDHHAARQQTVAQSLATWALGIKTSDVPEACFHQAKLLVLDSIGCAIAGAAESVCKSIISLCGEVGANGPCTIIGQQRRVDIPHAILANGTLLRVLDLNDYVVVVTKNGPAIGGHPSDNIPVALAVGEARRQAGRDILAAIVVGYEVFGRLKTLMDRKGPWDGVSISGIVAPVMAGRLMGLDATTLAHAIALSGTRTATPALVRHGGLSAAKSMANAMVAQSAAEATLLAERGLTGPLAVLEHPRGIRTVFPSGEMLGSLTSPFPADPYIMSSNVKAFPCVATAQAAAGAALKMHRLLNGKVDGLKRLELTMIDNPLIVGQQSDPDRVRPRSREGADHSFQYVAAVALTDGAFGVAQFDNERWLDPKINDLMNNFVMKNDPELNRRAPGTFPCVMRVEDSEGKEHIVEQLFPPGYSRGGIAEADVLDKFNSVSETLAREKRDRIASAALELDRVSSTESFFASLRP